MAAGRSILVCGMFGALVILAACSAPAPAPTADSKAGGTPGTAPPPGPPQGQGQPANPAPPPSAPPVPKVDHGPDDTPIVISDGSLWIGLNPLGGRGGGGGKSFSFSDFDRQPGDSSEVRALNLMDLSGSMRLTWDGIDINGVAPAACQNPAEDCLIQLQYEGPGMDLEAAWALDSNSRQWRLTLRFPGRPVNQWIDWVRDSHIIFHPLDWDHSARKKFQQMFLNRTAQPLDPNGTRLTIHLKPGPR